MWDELYRRFCPELTAYAAAAVRDTALAEDLVQETFLRALQNTQVFDGLGPSQQRAWLYRTLKNLICDRHRHTSVETRYTQAFEEDGVVQESGFQQAENALLLAKLPEEDRALFWLRYLEDYNSAELAEMFGIPAGTIRARLSRSRKLLKRMLSEK